MSGGIQQISKTAEFVRMVSHATDSLNENARPLFQEYILCEMKIRQLFGNEKAAEQVETLRAIQREDEKRLMELLRSNSLLI